MSQPFVGEIRPVPFNFAPVGWALCNGQTLSIAENEVLYVLIGTTYGGDGVNTFNLPNLQSRIPIGTGQGPGLSPYVIGQAGGVESVTLTANHLPQHNHVAIASSDHATSYSPVGNVPAVAARNVYSTSQPDTTMHALESAGGNQPHDNRQPFLVVNYIIALEGVFPSQN